MTNKETNVLAYEYPFLGLFWTMLWFFLWMAWIVMVFRVFADIFRSRDMGGFAKAIWSIVVILIPLIGVLIYLIARGDGMADRDVQESYAQEQAVQSYVRDVAGSGGTADELSKLAGLRDSGVLSEAEFQQQKAKLLS